MRIKRIITFFLAVLVSLSVFFTFSTPIVRANGDTVPTQYYQQLDLNGTLVYNVSAFGGPSSWYNYEGDWGSKVGDFESNVGGQIEVNITGFFNRDPEDTNGDLFPDTKMPWLDVEIFKNGEVNANFTRNNCSNSEAAGQLVLGYGDFKPGFLIPINNFTELKKLANFGSDWIWGAAALTIEETFNFIYFDFAQIGGGQTTELIYDKQSGLLVWANTSVGGYTLEIKSLNFTLNNERTYNYNIINFGDPQSWWNYNDSKVDGDINTNPSGVIKVNFTGDYGKHPNDYFNAFDNPIPWMNISFIENNSGVLNKNFTFVNRSNGECASNLIIGYNGFQSGFRVPVNNVSLLIDFAYDEKNGYYKGNVVVMESDLTIKILYNQYPSGQKTHMIYEKLTGLLLWVNTSLSNYLLEMKIEGYTPWFDEPAPETGPPPVSIIFLPYLIVIIVSVAIVVPFEFNSRVSGKSKKYALIAMIAASSFSGLFFFNTNMNILLGSSTLNQQVNNITLIVDYGNGTTYESPTFSLYAGKTTPYDALDAWCEVETAYYQGLGTMVYSINGCEPVGGWTYEIIGRIAGEVTTTALISGDTVKFIAHL